MHVQIHILSGWFVGNLFGLMPRQPIFCTFAASLASYFVVSLLLLTALALGQANIDIPASPTTNPWTHLNFRNDSGRFQFAIVGDNTGGHRAGIFEDAIRKLNLLQPEFVMSIGDLIEGDSPEPADMAREWDELQSMTARLEMPFFYVPGNHDLPGAAHTAEWVKRFGRTYYHFVYRDVLFLCLNSEDGGRAKMSAEQAAYVNDALTKHPDVRWTLVFFHQPLWVYEDRLANGDESVESTGWLDIEPLLKDRPYTVFAGHFHNYARYDRFDRRYIVLGTTGGKTQLRGPAFGEFDHVAWITMTDDGPVVSNLLLDGIWDEFVRTNESRQIVNALTVAALAAVDPIRAGSSEFTGATTNLRFANTAKHELKIDARFRMHEQLLPDPYTIELTLKPKSEESRSVKLIARAPASPADMKPLTADVTFRYDVPGIPRVEFERTLPIVIDPVTTCPKLTAAVAVDGKLDEWTELPFGYEPARGQIENRDQSLSGDADAALRFGIAHDDEFIYLAIRAIDDRVLPVEAREPFREDCVEVWLDARPDDVSAHGKGEVEQFFKDFLYIAVAPMNDGETYVYRKQKLPEGTKIACARSDDGYTIEIALPVSYLNQMQPAPWSGFRLNVGLSDRDEPGGPDAQIWWRPAWSGKQNYAGSGTISRN